MLYITNREEIEEYRENSAIGQSQLKKLLIGMDEFLKEDEDKKSIPMIIGSAVDTMLTGNEEDFDNLFHVTHFTKPSDLVAAILETVYNRVNDKLSDLESNIPLLEEAIIDFNYQNNWKMETKVNKLLEFSGYYEELQLSENKTVLSEEQFSIVKNVVESLSTNPITSKYLSRNQKSNVDMYLQLPIFWNYKDVSCKSLLDIVLVMKNKDEEIFNILPIDIKTCSGRTVDFLSSLKMRRYDIQAASYSLAVAKRFNVDPSIVDNFLFIVESTTDIGHPIIFTASDELLDVGLNGLPEVWYEGRLLRQQILGYDQLISLYKYYEQQGWQEEKIIYENAGHLVLSWDKVTGYAN